jgi:hypothetical protein
MVTRSDSRVNDLLRAEENISGIKKLLMAVSGLVFSALFGIGVWVGSNDTKLTRLESTVAEIEVRQRNDDLLGARLEIKLAAIESNLIDIKRSLLK